MSSAEPSPVTPDELGRDAKWLTQALDPATGAVRLVAMDRDSYRSASFLDDRLLQTPVDAQILHWPAVEQAMAGDLRSDTRWIFHIGHVGSTLVSRLLGELDGVLAIREPRLLRDLALSPAEIRGRYLAAVPKLMSRTFAEDEIACVKATSFASEIAAELVPPGERALLMYARPRNYVATILAGENSVKELHMLADNRAQRIAARVPGLPPPRSEADLAAVAWACEMTALEAAAEAMGDRLLHWVDFDALLDRLKESLAEAAAFFGFDAPHDQIEAIADGPLVRRYSKALEYDYSPELRQELLAEATQANSAAIDSAMAMLRSAAGQSPLLARALECSQAEG